MKFSALLCFSVASSVLVQAQRAQLPACVVACDDASIAASGCADSDLKCHCTRYSTIYQNVIPCVEQRSNCTNPVQSLLTLEQGFATACQTNLNITIPTGVTSVPTNTTNVTSSGNHSTSAPSTPSFTGVHASPNAGSLSRVDWIASTVAIAVFMVFY